MQATTTGSNRTGAATAAQRVREMLDANERWAPKTLPDTSLAEADRSLYIADSDAIGSIPPPATIQGVLKTGIHKLMGERPEMLMDKIGERIAFERSGTRLYDALIVKYRTLVDAGGDAALPLAEDSSADVLAALQEIRLEEHEHFLMLCEVMRSMGGDPTAQTPCAAVIATASMGLIQVVTDPRTTFAQSLNAMLTAELTDNAGWELLITMAQDAGENDMAERFQAALADEERHLATVRAWVQALALASKATTAA